MKKQMDPLGMLGWTMHSATCVCQRNASGIGASALCEPATHSATVSKQNGLLADWSCQHRIASRLELLFLKVSVGRLVGWLG